MKIIRVHKIFTLCIVVVAFLLTRAFSQGLAEQYKLGVNAGDVLTVPQIDTVQGSSVMEGETTLVIFTMAQNCDLCSALHHLAVIWQERYPYLQILLVDTRNDEQEVIQWVRDNNISVPVISDVDDAFESEFNVNRVPILFLVDKTGHVQYKVLGLSLPQYADFDQILSWAETDQWDKISDRRPQTLKVGEEIQSLGDITFPSDANTVLYQTSPTCDACRELETEDFQRVFNTLANEHPDVQFIILSSDVSDDAVEQLRSSIRRYTNLYGEQSLPPNYQYIMTTGLIPPDVQVKQLATSGWAPNINIVKYYDGSINDPSRWAKILTPNIMLFGPNGLYTGPEPFWDGPYTLSKFASTIEAFLDDN